MLLPQPPEPVVTPRSRRAPLHWPIVGGWPRAMGRIVGPDRPGWTWRSDQAGEPHAVGGCSCCWLLRCLALLSSRAGCGSALVWGWAGAARDAPMWAWGAPRQHDSCFPTSVCACQPHAAPRPCASSQRRRARDDPRTAHC